MFVLYIYMSKHYYDPFELNEPPVKIIISGHSSNPNEYDDDNNYFNVPGNYHIHF